MASPGDGQYEYMYSSSCISRETEKERAQEWRWFTLPRDLMQVLKVRTPKLALQTPHINMGK